MRKATIVLVLLFCLSSLNTFQASNVNHQFSEDAFKCSQQNVSEGASIDCEITDLNFTNVNQIRYRFVADEFDQEIKSVPGKHLISTGYVHTCAILDNASTMCWGSDGDGRLGNGGEDNTISKPTDYVINPEERPSNRFMQVTRIPAELPILENSIAGEIITTGKME